MSTLPHNNFAVKAVLQDDDFKRIATAVYDHCGINLHEGKRELVQARIIKRLHATNKLSVREYLDYAFHDKTGEEFSHFIDSISTNLTSFFRENSHLTYLAEQLLPKIEARATDAGQRKLRAWSAGCSTGEEPYSIMITLLENLKDVNSWDLKLLATDISTRVLKSSKAGIYDAARLATVPAIFRSKYFDLEKAGETCQVKPVLKKHIFFAYLNLMENWPFQGPFNFIFCRNVMIYFDKPTQERLVNRFYEVLAPGGVLFTGHSESLTGVKHSFKYIQPTIYGKA